MSLWYLQGCLQACKRTSQSMQCGWGSVTCSGTWCQQVWGWQVTYARSFKSKSSSFNLVGVRDKFGLVRVKSMSLCGNPGGWQFWVYGVFASVHGNVLLMLLSEQWLRYESWLSSLHKILCRFKRCKSGMNLVVATQQMAASTVQRCTFFI